MLRTKCPTCNVLPGSLLDNPNLVPWTLQLRKAIMKLRSARAAIWGLHNYSDVNRLKDTSTRQLLARSRARSGSPSPAASSHATSPTASKFPQGAAYAGKVAKYILGPLIKANPRIERVYFYNWKPGGTSRSWDSGLVSADGQRAPRLPGHQERSGRRRAYRPLPKSEVAASGPRPASEQARGQAPLIALRRAAGTVPAGPWPRSQSTPRARRPAGLLAQRAR